MTTTHEFEPGTVATDERGSTSPGGQVRLPTSVAESSCELSANTDHGPADGLPKPRLMASDPAQAAFCGGEEAEPCLRAPDSDHG
jgi:hypothetical protein